MDLNRIGRGAFGNAFSRAAGVDDLNAVSTLAPEVMPVLSLDGRPEFWALQGGKLGSCYAAPGAGGAGTTGYAVLVNPTGSGVMAIVEQLINGGSALLGWTLDLTTTTGAAADVSNRDVRNAEVGDINNGLGCKFYADATGGGGVTFMGASAGPVVVPVDLVLMPGSRIIITPPVNTAFQITLQWRERPLGPAERQI